MFPVGSRSRNRGRGFAFNRGAKIPPSVVFDFLRDTVDSRISFTRSSSKTYINSSGVIALAATDAWPVEYDPVTLRRIGRNLAEARTNLFLNSLIDGTNLGTQSVTVAATPYTVSFYGTGTITFSGAFAGSLVGSGAYPTRSTVTFTPSAGSLTCTVTGTVQFAQIEAGSYVTPFIPTAGAPVPRSIDLASITGTNFSGFWNPTQGTFVARYMLVDASNGSNQFVARASDNSYNNSIAMNTNATGFPAIATASGGVFDGVATAAAALTDSVFSTVAVSYSAAGISISKDGAAVVTDSSLTFPTGMTRLDIGGDHAGANHFGSGWIQSLVYYPQAMPTLLRSLSA